MNPHDHVLKTYRYLRLSMASVLVMLAASVAIEWLRTGGECWQTSISAYYYTPVQAIFVGTLVSVGVSMVVLKGNTEWEDILLNIGGMFAPVVALVPTPEAGMCRSVALETHDIPANVTNNVWALFVVGTLGVVITIVLAIRDRQPGAPRSLDRRHAVGIAAAVGALLGGVVWFVWGRASFVDGAHYTAAVGLFACIVGVVASNGRGYRRARGTGSRMDYTNRYFAIAVAMVVSAGGMGLWTGLIGWDHGLLWIEGTLIFLFALFWLIQTRELWDEALRETRPLAERHAQAR